MPDLRKRKAMPLVRDLVSVSSDHILNIFYSIFSLSLPLIKFNSRGFIGMGNICLHCQSKLNR
jgi:hypothetical protein